MTSSQTVQLDSPVKVRQHLVDALRLDLVGPGEVLGAARRTVGSVDEVLSQRPSTWYLTGFLVPFDASVEQKQDDQSDDEFDELDAEKGTDDDTEPDRAPARTRYLPSSIGASMLVPGNAQHLKVIVRWGDYSAERLNDGTANLDKWSRLQSQEQVLLPIPKDNSNTRTISVPKSNGLSVVITARPVPYADIEGGLPKDTRSISLFLVNYRIPAADELRDESFAFQVQLEIESEEPFIARPDLRSLESNDWDNRVADLQYRDAFEFAVGHGVATEAIEHAPGECRLIRTCSIPQAEVERVAPTKIPDVELSMDILAEVADAEVAREKLAKLSDHYREWIEEQKKNVPPLPAKRFETGEELLRRARKAADRIEDGIKNLADPLVLEAFQITNRAMAAAARRRLAVMRNQDPSLVNPEWRPFQLAFLLMNIPSIADPQHVDREVVDLLFFPTGGGKTEAYLGLAAFTLVMRRLKNPGISSAGLSVLMRYTLRLLTLDQLGRAATLICALELERRNSNRLGDWPFEIGLWVGRDATPNRMGDVKHPDAKSARTRTLQFKANDSKPSPIPLEECPWCGRKFSRNSFELDNRDYPTELRIVCVNRNCEFSGSLVKQLPIQAVDEPIYRRLPCFMIATVDKFAAMPWSGEVSQFFGNVQRYDATGFYGVSEPNVGKPLPSGKLLPPDLIIQDELHLISGPLGTIVGLYETALEELCRLSNENKCGPKIIASTATVRRADNQIRALFNHHTVDIFPPPGPDRRHSFFAETHNTDRSNARLYVGLAAFGRSPKVVALRTYVCLLSAAEKAYRLYSKKADPKNPADPYMTLLCYFNSLRELGGARRLIEDEVTTRVAGYGTRQRLTDSESYFANRKMDYEVTELTSRVSTDKVSEAKRRLSLPFSDDEHVDVAIATNMISVGLDITRLGLMVVFGQPKSSSEYIQATSRVGRDDQLPGLVITVLNNHKPRDRSYYERFSAYHQSFYRSVEVTSVTPFSPRALDRGLAGTLIGMARLCHTVLTPPLGAHKILTERSKLTHLVDTISKRAQSHCNLEPEECTRLGDRVRARVEDLLDEWYGIAHELDDVGGTLQYQQEKGDAQRLLYEFLNPKLNSLPAKHKKFRANRSMRDVEPNVNLWLKTPDGVSLDEEE